MSKLVKQNGNKVVEWELEGGKFKIKVDPNKDGEPVLELILHISEVPDEILSAF